MLLPAILAIGLGGLVMLVGLITVARKPREAADRTSHDLKRLGFAAIFALLGIAFLVTGFAFDPLWPDQDETPARRAARLAASAFSDRAYLASTIFSLGGILGGFAALRHSRRSSGSGLAVRDSS